MSRRAFSLSYLAMLAIAVCNPGRSIADDVYLRVSIECPAENERGELVTLDENAAGDCWRFSALLDGDDATKIVSAFSEKGSAFRDWIILDRAELQGKQDFQLLLAYEQSANELMRFYCNAAPEHKELYLDILQQNKETLKR